MRLCHFESDLVVSEKGILAFEDVVNSFEEADSISILTYNISGKAKNILLNTLYDLEKKEITIISNIPGRFIKYYSVEYQKRAHNKISYYLDALNPTKFKSKVRVYFNFSNHAKIVMSNKLAYIGSANYADESTESIDLGFLLSDPKCLRQIEKYVASVAFESEPYYDKNYIILASKAHEFFSLIDNCCTVLEDTYNDDFLNVNHPFNNILIEEINTAVAEVVAQSSKIDDYIIHGGNDAAKEKSELLLERISEVEVKFKDIQYEEAFYELIHFDSRSFEENYLEEKQDVATGEMLEFYAEEAVEEAQNKLADLNMACEGYVQTMIGYLKEIKLLLAEILSTARSISVNSVIDNAGDI